MSFSTFFTRRLSLYLALATLTQCSKCKQDPTPTKPEDQLPAATQTGAGTFGCLLNGQPWTPSGFNGRPNLQATYDPSFNGGNLDIRAYTYPDGKKSAQYIAFGGDQITKPGTYPITSASNPSPPGPYTSLFADGNVLSPCNMIGTRVGAAQTGGQFTITRLDFTARVVSGTFNLTFSQPGCTSIELTEGRFDTMF